MYSTCSMYRKNERICQGNFSSPYLIFSDTSDSASFLQHSMISVLSLNGLLYFKIYTNLQPKTFHAVVTL